MSMQPLQSAESLLGDTPGSWASVPDGKYHRTVSEKPDWRRDEQSLCGLTFQPRNVSWNEAPPTNNRWLCMKCLAKHRK